ncbi:hypothetical protein GCM10023310_01170 [Paenibacillus vulneris]|uniref:Helix-turn-helix domain-containing protein n=1 Tax=Paenibacillus vulneris TaxID=1133364 RepID=A0ABW3UZ13_9BACL
MVGYRLSKLRTERKKVTVDKVVSATGIPRETILSYENEGVEPTRAHLELFAAYYEVTIERLLGTDVVVSNYHICGGRTATAEELEDMRDALREIIQTKKRRIISI